MAQLPNYKGLIRDASGRLAYNPQDPRINLGQDDEGVDQFQTEQDVLGEAYESFKKTGLPIGDLGGGARVIRDESEEDGGGIQRSYRLVFDAPPTPQPTPQPAPVRPSVPPAITPQVPGPPEVPRQPPQPAPTPQPAPAPQPAPKGPATPVPSWVTPPPPGSGTLQALETLTNPVTGETYTAPTSGYTVNIPAPQPTPAPQPAGPQGTGTPTTTMRPSPTDPLPRGTVPDNLGKVTTEATATAAGLTDLAATLPPGTMIDPNDMIVQDEELFSSMRPADPIVGEEAAMVAASTAGINIATPPRQNAQTYSAYVQEGTPEYSAAQGQPSSESLIGDIQGAVSEQAIATAATGELDERATVKYQMDQLFGSFEEGKPPPAWAAPAVRAAGAMMAQRGMGKSSMAAAAITQAMMESGVSIAKEDANKYATIQITNLNNRQQASLQNALTFAAMDKANLNARMQAAVNNARVFLQMDTANLTNQQQLKTIDLQSQYQKMFNDQAQENASRQFNAKSQMQVDQFFSELEVQVANANSSRTAAMSQFNADQTNAGKRYFAKINDARDRFNIQNEALIQQANASWRRSINTANTAQRNEANRTNALNLLGYTSSAMDKVWQRYRDEASWAIQMSENDKQRAHNIAILAQQQAFDADQYGKDRDASFYDSVGNTVMNGIWGFLGA